MRCCLPKVSALTPKAELPPEAAECGRPTPGVSPRSRLSHYPSVLQLRSDHEGCLSDKFTPQLFHRINIRKKAERPQWGMADVVRPGSAYLGLQKNLDFAGQSSQPKPRDGKRKSCNLCGPVNNAEPPANLREQTCCLEERKFQPFPGNALTQPLCCFCC